MNQQQPPQQQQPPPQPQPPPQSQPEAGKSRATKRKGKNVAGEGSGKVVWSQVQEKALAECWINVAEDNRVGNSQTSDSFWYRVLEEFNTALGVNFTKHSITGKWTKMSKKIRSFIACYDRANRQRASGEDDLSVYAMADSFFQVEHGHAFKMVAAWRVLRGKVKFTNPDPHNINQARRQPQTQPDPINLEDDDNVNELFGQDTIPRPPGKPRASKSARTSSSSDVSSQFSDYSENLLKHVEKIGEKKTQAIEERLQLRQIQFLSLNTENMAPRDRRLAEKKKAEIRQKLEMDEDEEDSE